jgi:hypothetical protein
LGRLVKPFFICWDFFLISRGGGYPVIAGVDYTVRGFTDFHDEIADYDANTAIAALSQ